jgi:hypothetical protein
MRFKDMLWMRALALCAAMAIATAAEAAPAEIALFFGEFEGQAVSENAGEIRKRDLRVKISPFESGFTVNWVSVTKRSNGKLKRKEYSIDFLPTRRHNIFRSGERKDMFGNAVPLDPLKGEPYVWARIHDDTLAVYALHVLEDGGYEMQTYARTRIPEGLSLQYSRVRDGEILRTVHGTLMEVK